MMKTNVGIVIYWESVSKLLAPGMCVTGWSGVRAAIVCCVCLHNAPPLISGQCSHSLRLHSKCGLFPVLLLMLLHTAAICLNHKYSDYSQPLVRAAQ